MQPLLDYGEIANDEFEEIEALSTHLGCNMEIAHKILYLEERFEKLEVKQEGECEQLRSALKNVLPLAIGYAPPNQTDAAKATCRRWIREARELLKE